MVPHTGTETDQTPTGGSSEEYWAMDESLTQPCRVQDDGPTGCKLLLYKKKHLFVNKLDGIVRISIG